MSEKLTPKDSKEVLHNHEDAESNVERARAKHEKKSEKESKESLEEIRDSVEKHAETGSETVSKQAEKTSQPVAVTVKDKKQSYNQTMRRVRSRLSPTSKSFSKVIHAPVVEQASEFAGKTVARPSGLLGGGIAAVIGLSIVVFFARRSGFALAGSEFIILLVLGFIIGVSIEMISKAFKRS